ncbi:MAG: lipoyl(octanoyl) transferase LipB [Hormoscilla sp. SP5CHS1]|nr:lipoyl(octanoyl) transferase LipB [Hormoscilla sp. SP12CHS1]MBC6455253.1 lipoyl(octanoyl) transferase LipB [Hormoscilla sp. SP5CHS1]
MTTQKTTLRDPSAARDRSTRTTPETWTSQRRCWLLNQGVVPYAVAWKWQQQLVARRRDNPELDDVLILLSHPPVYTLGRGASLEHLKFSPSDSSFEVYRVERGGEVTYHCPGQLVGYPILNLRYYRQDLHWYLRQLEEVAIQTLAVYGLKGDRLPGLTGVWLDGRKVAAIGIFVSRWITMHGFALNVSPNLAGFERIVPCGLPDFSGTAGRAGSLRPVGSLTEFLPEINIEDVRQAISAAFSRVFQVQIEPIELGNSGSSLFET